MVMVENEFVVVGQKLDIYCFFKSKDFGFMILMLFNYFFWIFIISFFGMDVYMCMFVLLGKFIIIIDVFKGYSFKNLFCNCNGVDKCWWQVLNEGFWCNFNFVQKWG